MFAAILAFFGLGKSTIPARFNDRTSQRNVRMTKGNASRPNWGNAGGSLFK